METYGIGQLKKAGIDAFPFLSLPFDSTSAFLLPFQIRVRHDTFSLATVVVPKLRYVVAKGPLRAPQRDSKTIYIK